MTSVTLIDAGDVVDIPVPVKFWKATGGNATVSGRGQDYAGGTMTVVTCPSSDPDKRWEPLVDSAFTGNFDRTLKGLGKGTLIGVTLTGLTGTPVGLLATVEG